MGQLSRGRERRHYRNRRDVLLIGLVLLGLPVALVTAETPRPESSAALPDGQCSSTAHRAFDFLLGSWNVTSISGDDVGRVRVRSLAGGCGLREEWSNPGGREGVSLNVYSPESGFWHQSYVDNRGTVLRLRGGPVDSGMVLHGEPSAGGGALDRFGWFARPDGSIRQVWERSAGGDEWRVLFEATWTRVGAAPSAELSEAMRPLAGLLGDWKLTPIQQDGAGEWQERETTRARVEPLLGGFFLREDAEMDLGAGWVESLMLVGWDPFRKTYRLTWNDSLVGLPDVYEGEIVGGVLIVDNLKTETFWGSRDGSQEFAFRLEYELEAVDGVRRARVFISDDRGQTWSLFQTSVYRSAAR